MTDTITDPVAAGLSTGELETELLGLAGNLAAAQCRFLRLLAEFDRRDGWAGPGLKSCAHWLCWRIGMSLRTAAEHVRVAHALTRLPKITEAFAAGRISYSKVRAITRIAGQAATEPDPAGPDPGEPDAAESDPTESDPAVPDSAVPGRGGPGRSGGGPDGPGTAPDAEQVLLDLALAGTASHVETVVRATRRAQADPRRVTALRSLSWHYADDGALILRGRFTPDDGALLVAAVEALVTPRRPVTHPVPDAPEGWAESLGEQAPGAVADAVAARRADALLALVTATKEGDRDATVAGDRARVVVHIEAATGAARIEGGPEIPAVTAERLACDADAQVLLHDRERNALYLGRRRRFATPAQIAALTVRDGPGCRFPGCSHTRYLHAHHVRHWMRDGATDPDNLVLICSFHHRLVHELGYGVCRVGPQWVFSRPDGEPVPEAGAPLEGDTESLLETNTRARLRITRDSLTPSWGGERLDPDPILRRLLRRPRRDAA
jgi:Domain of unknown function (DUF222)/HNH endonuclease